MELLQQEALGISVMKYHLTGLALLKGKLGCVSCLWDAFPNLYAEFVDRILLSKIALAKDWALKLSMGSAIDLIMIVKR